MFRVCSTRPVEGAAKYSSRWRAEFQANVPTRPSPLMPRVSSTPASLRVRTAHSAYVIRVTPVGVLVDDRAVAVVLLDVPEDRIDGEGVVLHQPAHERSLPVTVLTFQPWARR